MQTFKQHITEAATDSTKKSDDTGYTSGRAGRGMLVGKSRPSITGIVARCEFGHDSKLASAGISDSPITLIAFKKTGIVSIRWTCPKCKAADNTPYVNQVQLGNWLANSVEII
jgi:hypothetical protein